MSLLEKEIKLLFSISRKKNFKPLWVVVELNSKFGKKYVLEKKTLSTLSKVIGEKEDKIIWFVKKINNERLDKKV